MKTVLVFTGIAVALVALLIILLNLLSVEAGWREIQSDGSMGIHCGDDFVFMAELGAQTGSPQAELKALTRVYTEATAEAYRMFSVYDTWEGENNLCTLNRNPNVPVTLPTALVDAMKTVCAASRYLYLAPVYEVNVSLFNCAADYEAYDFNPMHNPDVRAYFAEICAFANDESAVNLEFPDDHTAVLWVSDAYAAFARENGVSVYVDFGWMKNAFIADYLAERVRSSGLTCATIASYDGFVRNLDARGGEYAVRVFRRDGDMKLQQASATYVAPAALATLRGFPVDAAHERNYYVSSDGAAYAPYADPADGLPRCAVQSLTGISERLDCGDLLARLMPVYIADELDASALDRLAEKGVGLVYSAEEGFAQMGGIAVVE